MPEEYKDLKEVCDKFVYKQYTIADLSRALSWIAVPDELGCLVDKAERKLEWIRFLTPEEKQYEEALKVIRELLNKIQDEIN